MQQIIKKLSPLHLIATVMLAMILFVGCNNGETKTEEPSTAAPAVEKAPETKAPDTMPKIDTSATSRPEPIKN